MVNPTTLPAVVYGKLPAPGRVPQEYRILAHHRFASADMLRAVEDIPGGFGWTQASALHEPCFGFVCVGRRGIALRLADLGADDQGRPHCLRLEAALLDGEESPFDPRRLSTILSKEAWPSEPVELGEEPTVSLCAVPPDQRLVEALGSLAVNSDLPSVLVGKQSSFTNSFFDLVVDPFEPNRPVHARGRDGMHPTAILTSRPGQRLEPEVPVAGYDAARPRQARRFLLGLALGAGSLGAGLGWWAYRQSSQLEETLRTLDAQRQELAEHEGRQSDLRRALNESRRNLDVAQQDRSTLRSTLGRWTAAARQAGVEQPDQLASQIAALHADANRSVEKENDRLRRQLNLAEEKLQRIRAVIIPDGQPDGPARSIPPEH